MSSFFFDFDSTVIAVESLDEIIRLSVAEMPDRAQASNILSSVEALTVLGMNGTIDLRESLRRRLALTRVHRRHIHRFADRLRVGDFLTPGMPALFAQLQQRGQDVFILSGGLQVCLEAVRSHLSLPVEHVYGNTCVFDNDGYVIGFDESNPLSTTDGKAVLIERLIAAHTLRGALCIIGDGMSDARPYLRGIVDHFVGFGMHVERLSVRQVAPLYVTTVRELHSTLFSCIALA